MVRRDVGIDRRVVEVAMRCVVLYTWCSILGSRLLVEIRDYLRGDIDMMMMIIIIVARSRGVMQRG